MTIGADRYIRVAVCQERPAVRARQILLVDTSMALAAIRGYLVPRLARPGNLMASVAIDAHGGIPIAGRQRSRMVPILFQLILPLMAGLTLPAVLHLIIAPV